MARHITPLLFAVVLLALWAVEDKQHLCSKGYNLITSSFKAPIPLKKTVVPEVRGRIEQGVFSPPEKILTADECQDWCPFRFAAVLGPDFNQEKLPRTAALFDKVKGVFIAHSIDASTNAQTSKSAPASSFHRAAWEQLVAIILSAELPEKAEDIHASVQEKEASLGHPVIERSEMIAAAVVAGFLFQDSGFRSAFEDSRTETRRALGYTL